MADSNPRIYQIVRFSSRGTRRVIRRGLTRGDARAWCSREDTHGTRGGVRWFDGFEIMPGCTEPTEECA